MRTETGWRLRAALSWSMLFGETLPYAETSTLVLDLELY